MSAAPASSSQIDLAWTDNSTNEDGFRIERKTTGSFTEIATVGPNTTSFNDTGLSASTSYTYRVRAYNTAGNSGYSNEASATTSAGGNTTVDIFVAEDAYVRGGSNASTNYGSATTLVVKESANLSFTRRTFLKFDLTSYTSISSARLFVYGSAQQGMNINAYKVSPDTWSESTITWNNAPTFGTYIGAASVGTSDQWYEIDVTSAAKDEITGNGTFSIGLKDDAVLIKTITLFSKENAQSQFRAYLVVTGSTGAGSGARVSSSSAPAGPGPAVSLMTPEKNVSSTIEVRLYPNPTPGILNVTKADIDRVEVFQLNGALVRVFDRSDLGGRNEIDLLSLGTGVYQVKIYQQNGELTFRRIMKTN